MLVFLVRMLALTLQCPTPLTGKVTYLSLWTMERWIKAGLMIWQPGKTEAWLRVKALADYILGSLPRGINLRHSRSRVLAYQYSLLI